MVATKTLEQLHILAYKMNPTEWEIKKKQVWVSLDEYNKLKDKFTIRQICKKCGGKTYCLFCSND